MGDLNEDMEDLPQKFHSFAVLSRAGEDIHDERQSQDEHSRLRRSESSVSKTLTTTQALTNQIVSEMESSRERHKDKMRGFIYRTAESPAFEIAISSVIVLNSVMIGVDAEFNFENDSAAGERLNLITTWFFAVSYCIEFIIKISAYGFAVYFTGEDRYANLMDCFLTVIGVVEAILLSVAETGSMKNAMLLRGFRVLRFLRMIRMVRAFRQLQLFMAALWDAFKVVIWGLLLTLIVIYMAAVYTKTLMEDHLDDEESRDAWGSLSAAMYSYFRITTLDDWAELTRPVLSHYPYMAAFFIIFICVTAFAFINVMTAVVVESVLSRALANNAEAETKAADELKGAIRSIYEAFSSADMDNDHMLSRDEFHAGLRTPNIRRALLNADISLEDVEELFDVLDHEGTGSLTLEEFMEGCLRGRGVAKGKDLLLVACDLRRYMTSVISLLVQLFEAPAKKSQEGRELSPEILADESMKRLLQLRSRTKMHVWADLDACSHISHEHEQNLQNGESDITSPRPALSRSASGAVSNGCAGSSRRERSTDKAGSSGDGAGRWDSLPDALDPQECLHPTLISNVCGAVDSPASFAVQTAPIGCRRCMEAQARAERAEAEVRELKSRLRAMLEPMQDLAREHIEYL